MDLNTAQKQGFVIGLSSLSGTLPRREIDDMMVNDPDCFNLFILALARIMADESKTASGQQDKMNYFQIAGIHGLPLVDWDNVHVPGARGKGSYCTHNSFLFPSWHRPYLAMMEQTLYYQCGLLASEFQDPKYSDAAKRFRIPYWDWIKPRARRNTTFPGVSSNRTVSFPYNYDLPVSLTLAQLMVYKPGNEHQLVPLDNPLLHYTFPEKNGVKPEEFARLDLQDRQIGQMNVSRKRTVRNPQRSNDRDGFSVVSRQLNMYREGSVESALDLISNYDKYLDFAAESPRWRKDSSGNNIPGTLAGPSGSLEDIHNTYHGITGGAGHMGRVPLAAFDPIFWLHHCNIDRILSVWQATHTGPDSYLPAGSTGIGKDVPLWPFRKGPSKDNFWTSAQAQNPTTFGYTYDDLEGSQAQIVSRWDASYRWSLQSNDQLDPPDWMDPDLVDFRKAQALQFQAIAAAAQNPMMVAMMASESHGSQMEAQGASSLTHTEEAPEENLHQAKAAGNVEQAPKVEFPDAKVPEVQDMLQSASDDAKPVVQWYVDVQVERDALNGAFTIFIFLSDADGMAAVDQHPEHYAISPFTAGLTKIFTAPREACDLCNRDVERGAIVTGTNPITPMLRDYITIGRLEGLASREVVPFLQKSLYWRVVGCNGQREDESQIPGLKMSISSTRAVHIPGSGMPESWTSQHYPEATEGRTNGNPHLS